MPSEMLSGPDLGGGCLHQLTLEHEGEPGFVFHAQAGGADANGPPLGPLDALGFSHPASACAFGGPRCWHRCFTLAAAEAPRVRLAYNRMRFALAAMLEQVYAQRRPTIAAALEEIAARLEDPARAPQCSWYVGGSTAAWIHGAKIEPHDLDLGTDPMGVGRIAATLPEYLIEPFAPTDWGSLGRRLAARAFVGTMRDGARVEWSCPPVGVRPARWDEWGGDVTQVRAAQVDYKGFRIWATRPEYALVRALEKGPPARVAAIADAVVALGPDRELLMALLSHSSLAPSAQSEARARFLA